MAYAFYDTPVGRLPLMSSIARRGGWVGAGQVLSGPRLGDLLFTGVFNFMMLTVGWHYTKQVFGCMMVYALLRRLPADAVAARPHEAGAADDLGDELRPHQHRRRAERLLAVPLLLVRSAGHRRPAVRAVVFGGLVLVVYKVFYANYRDHGAVPSLNMLVPFIALYVWWMPQTRQFEFYFLLTPLFHSLQYLAFVYKMEDTRLRGGPHREVRATALVFGLVLAGWLAFEFVPNTLDNALGTFTRVADVLLLHRGDAVHQHPPLLHRQRAVAVQGPGGARLSAVVIKLFKLFMPIDDHFDVREAPGLWHRLEKQ